MTLNKNPSTAVEGFFVYRYDDELKNATIYSNIIIVFVIVLLYERLYVYINML